MYQTIRSFIAPSNFSMCTRFIAGAALLMTLPSISQAQFPDIGAMLQQQIGKELEKQMKQRIVITDSIIVADAQKKTATIEFSNLSTDTLEAEITTDVVGLARRVRTKTNDEANDGNMGMTLQVDTIPKSQSLVTWIRKLPPRIKLAPNEKKSVTVDLFVPVNVKAGEYAAWIFTATKASAGQGDKQSTPMKSASRIVYHEAAK